MWFKVSIRVVKVQTDTGEAAGRATRHDTTRRETARHDATRRTKYTDPFTAREAKNTSADTPRRLYGGGLQSATLPPYFKYKSDANRTVFLLNISKLQVNV